MELKESYEVLSTSNYSMFKLIEENREIDHYKKIIASIEGVGYVPVPIIVNEKFEIIDGQNRYMACKELGLPIYYIVIPGLNIEHCRALNIGQSNWRLMDYIKSYAASENASYILLLELLNKYKKLGIVAIYNAITGADAPDNNKIKAGAFEMTEGNKKYADSMLEYESRFIPIVNKMKGRKDYIYMAIGYAFRNPSVDNEKMYDKICDNYAKMADPVTKIEALEELTKIYNRSTRSEGRIYLKSDYEKEMNNKYAWYEEKWLKPRAQHERTRHYY